MGTLTRKAWRSIQWCPWPKGRQSAVLSQAAIHKFRISAALASVGERAGGKQAEVPGGGRASSYVRSCTNIQPCGGVSLPGEGSASPRIPFGYTHSPGFQQWHPSEGAKINPNALSSMRSLDWTTCMWGLLLTEQTRVFWDMSSYKDWDKLLSNSTTS